MSNHLGLFPEPNNLLPATDLPSESKKYIRETSVAGTIVVGSRIVSNSLGGKMTAFAVLANAGDSAIYWTSTFIALWCVDHLTRGAGSSDRHQRLWNTLGLVFVASVFFKAGIDFVDPDYHRGIVRILMFEAIMQAGAMILIWACVVYNKRRLRKKSALPTA